MCLRQITTGVTIMDKAKVKKTAMFWFVISLASCAISIFGIPAFVMAWIAGIITIAYALKQKDTIAFLIGIIDIALPFILLFFFMNFEGYLSNIAPYFPG